jgi:fibronectin-binding autotransporter adhesin
MNTETGRHLVALLLIACATFCRQAKADDRTWNGLGGDDYWSTTDNWDVAIAPGDALVFGGALRLTPNNDTAADTTYSGIAFNGDAGAFTLSGNGLTLGDDVVNNATNLQTLSLDLTLDGARAFNAVSGIVALAGTAVLDLNGNDAAFVSGAQFVSNAVGVTITDDAAGAGTSWLTINNVGNQPVSLDGCIVDGASRKVGLVIRNNAYWNTTAYNTNNTYSGGTLVTGTAGSGSRLPFGVSVGAYHPTLDGGNLVASEIGVGAVTLGTNASDKGQLLFYGSTDANFYNAIVFNTMLGADLPGGVRFGRNDLVLHGTQAANLANASYVGNGGNTFSIAGKVTGNAGLEMRAEGNALTLTLVNATSVNDYAGDTRILRANTAADVSTLRLGWADQIPDGTGKGNVNVVGKLQLNGFSETINGLNNTGVATYSVVENSHASTPVTLTLGGGDANGSYTGAIRNGGAASLGLTKIGAGTQTVGGTLAYTGATVVHGGTLRLGGALTNSGPFQMTGTSTLDLNGNNATFASGAQVVSNAVGTTITDNATGTGTSVLTINNNNDTSVSLSGVIADGATRKVGLAISNNSYWESTIYNSNNTYSGGTLVSGGTGNGSRLAFGIAGAASSYTPTLDGGGNLIRSQIGTGAVTLGTDPTDKGQLMFSGDSVAYGVDFYNDIVFNTVLGADLPGGVRLGKSGMVLHGTQTANLANASYVGNGGATLSIAGKITGNSGLEMRAEGNDLTLTLANTTSVNDYAGDTRIMRGVATNDIATLKLGAADQIPDGAGKGNVNVVGKLQLNGFDETINGLTNSAAIFNYSIVENGHASTDVTLTLGAGDADGSYDGTIRDGGEAALSVAKIGAGTQTLSGRNLYSGATVVSQGTLKLTQEQCLTTNTTVWLASGATLNLDFAGTNVIQALYIDGVLQPYGSLGPSSHPSLQGTGFLWPLRGTSTGLTLVVW